MTLQFIDRIEAPNFWYTNEYFAEFKIIIRITILDITRQLINGLGQESNNF